MLAGYLAWPRARGAAPAAPSLCDLCRLCEPRGLYRLCGPRRRCCPQVVIKAGPSPGINVNVAVSDSPALGSGTSCATGVSATDADVAVSCAATGRYLTISSTDSSSPMALCRWEWRVAAFQPGERGQQGQRVPRRPQGGRRRGTGNAATPGGSRLQLPSSPRTQARPDPRPAACAHTNLPCPCTRAHNCAHPFALTRASSLPLQCGRVSRGGKCGRQQAHLLHLL